MGLLALVFPTLTCPGSCPGLFTRRSPPRLFTAAARASLRPAPESRSRGAYPHLLCSFTTRIHRISDSFRDSAAHIMSQCLLSSKHSQNLTVEMLVSSCQEPIFVPNAVFV